MSSVYRVFVYGTLKRGEPNHNWLYKPNGTSKYLGEAKTEERYPLIIGTKYNIPFLLYSPGVGHNVIGELYEVDCPTLKNLDVLEDHPNYYIREEHPIIMNDSKQVNITAWIYFLKNFKPDLLSKTMFESYSNNGSHGLKYHERYLRNDSYDYKAEVFVQK